MASFVNKKIHLNIDGKRTTINLNIYLTALFLRKHTSEVVNPLTISDTNISTARKLIQAEIDKKAKNPLTNPFRKDRLKERVDEYLINQIADPKLL
jgi:hypothetical protein